MSLSLALMSSIVSTTMYFVMISLFHDVNIVLRPHASSSVDACRRQRIWVVYI